MSTQQWLNHMRILFSNQAQPAWKPAFLWLTLEQRINLLEELLAPLSKPSR